ncbi:MAG TPA: chromate resistance protein ChrB domain-containing protein [Gemmatimonadales bacterium]
MQWITRERPKIDRIACPWLIWRFIDPAAEFLFVPSADVLRVAGETGAIPFDVARARRVAEARVPSHLRPARRF